VQLRNCKLFTLHSGMSLKKKGYTVPNTLIGMRIRERRKSLKISQVDLAKRLDISPSYLNLIENNKRGIAGKLLSSVAAELNISLKQLDGSSDRHLLNELIEITADPSIQSLKLNAKSAAQLMGRDPEWAQAMVTIYRSLQDKNTAVMALSDRLNHDPFLSDAVHKMLSNIAALRSTSDILSSVGVMDDDQRQRFHDILTKESRLLSEVGEALASFFDKSHTENQTVGPIEEVDHFLRVHNNYFGRIEHFVENYLSSKGISEMISDDELLNQLQSLSSVALNDILNIDDLPESRRFKLAKNIMAVICFDEIETLINNYSGTINETAVHRLRSVLSSYAASALLMPYDRFLSDAMRLKYDIERLQRRYRTSFEQTCHRLSTLKRNGNEGIPFAFVRAGPAGHITKRYALPRLSFPSYGAACPLWVLYRAFLRPERLTRQIVEFPNGDQFLFVAKASPKGQAGFDQPKNYMSVMLACDINHSDKTVYSNNVDITHSIKPEAVGSNCRVCTRANCLHRAGDPVLGV